MTGFPRPVSGGARARGYFIIDNAPLLLWQGGNFTTFHKIPDVPKGESAEGGGHWDGGDVQKS